MNLEITLEKLMQIISLTITFTCFLAVLNLQKQLHVQIILNQGKVQLRISSYGPVIEKMMYVLFCIRHDSIVIPLHNIDIAYFCPVGNFSV